MCQSNSYLIQHIQLFSCVTPVSYTHLDVYKRQKHIRFTCPITGELTGRCPAPYRYLDIGSPAKLFYHTSTPVSWDLNVTPTGNLKRFILIHKAPLYHATQSRGQRHIMDQRKYVRETDTVALKFKVL